MMPEAPETASTTLQTALRAAPRGPVHLIPFIPAGFGGYETTRGAILAVVEAGASAVEVGIPFSDPIADGPVIQGAYYEALQRGTTVDGVLECVREVRREVTAPMLAMVSYSIVFRAGAGSFCRRARRAGLDGLLCPDLPLPAAFDFCHIARGGGVEPVLLVAPTTSPARRDEIGRLAGGFIYYLSVAGVTGERKSLPSDLAAGVSDMKRRTGLPVCVGFGIGRADQLSALRGLADGAVVGSAYVRRMQETMGAGAAAVGAACGELTRQLLGGGRLAPESNAES